MILEPGPASELSHVAVIYLLRDYPIRADRLERRTVLPCRRRSGCSATSD